MRQGIVKTIDGKDYEIWHLPPLEAMKVLTKILKIVLEPIGKAIGRVEEKEVINVGNEENQEEKDKEKSSILDTDINLEGLFTTLSNRLDENEIQNIMKKMFEYVYKKNDSNGFIKINLNVDFKGEFFHMLNVLKEALIVNYSDFFFVIGDQAKAPFIKKIVQTLEKQI